MLTLLLVYLQIMLAEKVVKGVYLGDVIALTHVATLDLARISQQQGGNLESRLREH